LTEGVVLHFSNRSPWSSAIKKGITLICWMVYTNTSQWTKSPKKCIFDNMALYFVCRINKSALLQAVFWRFCPLGRPPWSTYWLVWCYNFSIFTLYYYSLLLSLFSVLFALEAVNQDSILPSKTTERIRRMMSS